MILFKLHHVKLILDGKKTQTRRDWKKARALVDSIHQAKTEMLTGKYFATLKIKRVWKEMLGAISPEDVIKEGYKTKDEYIDAFFEINKIIKPEHCIDWLRTEIWCVEFELVDNNYDVWAADRKQRGLVIA